MTEPRLESQASGKRAVDDRDVNLEVEADPLINESNEKLCAIAKARGIEHAQRMTREELLAVLRPGQPRNLVNEPEGPRGPAPPAAAPDFEPH